jgi:hypothetical protein
MDVPAAMMQAFDWLESEVRSARRAEAPFDDWRVGGVAIADEFQCGAMVFEDCKILTFFYLGRGSRRGAKGRDAKKNWGLWRVIKTFYY